MSKPRVASTPPWIWRQTLLRKPVLRTEVKGNRSSGRSSCHLPPVRLARSKLVGNSFIEGSPTITIRRPTARTKFLTCRLSVQHPDRPRNVVPCLKSTLPRINDCRRCLCRLLHVLRPFLQYTSSVPSDHDTSVWAVSRGNGRSGRTSPFLPEQGRRCHHRCC